MNLAWHIMKICQSVAYEVILYGKTFLLSHFEIMLQVQKSVNEKNEKRLEIFE